MLSPPECLSSGDSTAGANLLADREGLCFVRLLPLQVAIWARRTAGLSSAAASTPPRRDALRRHRLIASSIRFAFPTLTAPCTCGSCRSLVFRLLLFLRTHRRSGATATPRRRSGSSRSTLSETTRLSEEWWTQGAPPKTLPRVCVTCTRSCIPPRVTTCDDVRSVNEEVEAAYAEVDQALLQYDRAVRDSLHPYIVRANPGNSPARWHTFGVSAC